MSEKTSKPVEFEVGDRLGGRVSVRRMWQMVQMGGPYRPKRLYHDEATAKRDADEFEHPSPIDVLYIEGVEGSGPLVCPLEDVLEVRTAMVEAAWLRERALSKLSDDEKAALGLPIEDEPERMTVEERRRHYEFIKTMAESEGIPLSEITLDRANEIYEK